MGVEESWKTLFGKLQAIAEPRSYRAADDLLAAPVRDLVLYDDSLHEPSGGLVHYTSWENLLRIFDVKDGNGPVFRMYNYESANDPQEGLVHPPEWTNPAKEVRTLLRQYAEGGEPRTRRGSTYGCSFSTNGKGVEDDLMFWRLYGNDGEGCSLKLGAMPTSTAGIPRMYQVRYRGGRRRPGEKNDDRDVAERMVELLRLGKETIQRAPERDRKHAGRSIARVLRQVLEGYCHLVKSRTYEHENEWRMIRVRPPKDEIRYDVSDDRVVRRYVLAGKIADLFLSASRVTLGPKVPNGGGAAKDYIESLIKEYGMEAKIEVKVSSKRYR